jgi:hypothetical protein
MQLIIPVDEMITQSTGCAIPVGRSGVFWEEDRQESLTG